MANQIRTEGDGATERTDHDVPAQGSQALFMLDPGGHVASWSTLAERLTGYRAEEIVGQHVALLSTVESSEAGWAPLLQRAEREGAFVDERWCTRRDGSRFRAQLVLSVALDAAGRALGFSGLLAVAPDLRPVQAEPPAHSERRVMTEKLHESEERFRALVEQVSEYAIFMLDPNGVITTWNAGAQRIKGYTTDEILGRHFSIFYEPAEVQSGKCERELAQAASEGCFEEEGWRSRKDGSRFWASVLITALRGPQGELLGFAKVTRDLTERRSTEDERIRLARAEESIRLRDEFLAIASHELKTPLTALQLQLQSLQERIESMDVNMARKLERAARSGSRLSNLIESLTDVSLMAVGRFVLHCAPFDMSDVVEHLLESLRSTAHKVGSELLLDAPEPLLGIWDKTRVEQVLTNLISNALKYGAGKPISVSVARSGEQVVLEVRDQGPGLAEHDLSRIFARFERSGSLRHYGGLGLGLYLTREIVEAHGGAIVARNMPEGGAAFSVRLPFDARARAHHASGAEVH